ncbi:ubiquinone biosynthesis accessory factor UbiJ [Shewanella dokdonensis]|uniref:ubiquinone biosynthesis accessory factor UbiJ n=1 Tax=Shewanella dokdonensis TaxID=712036 RepID=UPI00200D6633|nr:SCP2 sterol-binding domain-containing protein [Shewanella dokdonensis]MCL1075251.1 SCP2 sterol-binding domain-containing protein [Shewanella dokdonensis]
MTALSLERQWRLLSCSALETALAKLVQAAGSEALRLKPLHGKVFCFQLQQLSWPLYLVFANEIQVLSDYQGIVDVKVIGNATDLYRLREGESLTELIKQDKLRIEGDLTLLQQFSNFLQNVSMDIAEPLSTLLGDAPAYWLSSSANRASEGLRQVLQKTWSHLGQLATEEYKVAPHKLEFIRHCDRIDELTAAVDALEQRIATLKDKISP